MEKEFEFQESGTGILIEWSSFEGRDSVECNGKAVARAMVLSKHLGHDVEVHGIAPGQIVTVS